MDIVLYECCDGTQRHIGEESTRFAWLNSPIDIDQPISMNGVEADWRIADIITYKNTQQSEIEHIHFAYVYRGDVPPLRSEWPYLKYREDYPTQAFEIQIAQIGGNFIGWVAHINGDAPATDKYNITYGIRPDGTRVTRVEPWFKTKAEVFTSEDSVSPFATLYLSHHIIKPIEAAADEKAEAARHTSAVR
ncbi:MAG: hypothetical protein WA949_07355 [Phormidesmis sp.]